MNTDVPLFSHSIMFHSASPKKVHDAYRAKNGDYY